MALMESTNEVISALNELNDSMNKFSSACDSQSRQISAVFTQMNFMIHDAQRLYRENDELRCENERLHAVASSLSKLIRDMLGLLEVDSFDCCGCMYDEHESCEDGCMLAKRARELGLYGEERA